MARNNVAATFIYKNDITSMFPELARPLNVHLKWRRIKKITNQCSQCFPCAESRLTVVKIMVIEGFFALIYLHFIETKPVSVLCVSRLS